VDYLHIMENENIILKTENISKQYRLKVFDFDTINPDVLMNKKYE